MDIKLTTDWILDKMSYSSYSDGNGNATLICSDEDYHWLKLAFDTMGIEYTDDEFFDDENDQFINPEYHFGFNLEDIKEYCPNVYKNLSIIDKANKARQQINAFESPNYVHTDGRTLTFEECEEHSDKISSKNLGLLANHLCVDELAKHIDGFIEQDGLIFVNIDGEFISIIKNEKEND